MNDNGRNTTRHSGRRVIIGVSALIFALLLIGVAMWASNDNHAARNDPRAGTTTEMSPKNPVPAPGGGAGRGG